MAAAPAGGGANVGAALAATPGSPVTVTGLYLGWKGPCRSQPPTRSAWQLADAEAPGSACIYVDGPMPSGVSPVKAAGQNIRVRVQGVIREEAGARHIQAQQVVRQ